MSRPKINTIYAPAWKLREQAHIQKTLGTGEICERCHAKLATYHDQCSADLDDPCPGFQAIEMASASFKDSEKP